MGKKEAMLYSQAHRMALGWIDVKRMLPEVGELVLISGEHGPCNIGELRENGEWNAYLPNKLEDVVFDVKAWMPLPHSFESIRDDLEEYAE